MKLDGAIIIENITTQKLAEGHDGKEEWIPSNMQRQFCSLIGCIFYDVG